ncbi:MAG: hypothetical protein KDK70_13015 [Myxococcales bacterium]|nr:hypothetical protein [Myxococcales bacterium]
MTSRPAPRMPRRPSRDRAAQVAASLPDDDRFAPHPHDSIDVIYVIGRAAHLVAARPKEVVGVMLASLAIAGILVAGAMSADALDAERSQVVLWAVVLAWAFGLLLQAPLVGAAIEVHTERRGLALEFLRRGLARFGALLAASLAVLGIGAVVGSLGALVQWGLVAGVARLPLGFASVMVTFLGSLAVLLVVLRIVTAFSLVIPILLVEGLAPAEALRRSWQLGWPNGTPIYLALLLPALLAQFVLFLAGYLPLFISLPVAVVLVVGLSLYNSAIVPASYVVIREYVDGLDPARLLGGAKRSRGGPR